MAISAQALAFSLASWRVRLQDKRRISAMVRVRNEEEFLYAAVTSIIQHVTDVVIVDNLSIDGTPDVIARIRREHPGKVTAHRYPFEIRKVGREHWELARSPAGRASPNLSSTFYNWALRLCREPFVLKWDGDMIATPAFAAALDQWRASPKPILVFNGENVYPDRTHRIQARITDRNVLLAKLTVPGLPRWVTTLAEDFQEPRLFPRFAARYDNATRWTQALASPFEHRDYRKRARVTAAGPCFLHMKFCKRDALANYSDDLRAVIEDNISVGEPLSSDALAVLAHYQLACD